MKRPLTAAIAQLLIELIEYLMTRLDEWLDRKDDERQAPDG